MMHKRNLTLTALAWAAVITVLFLIFPRIYHGPLGWWYLPNLVLAVIISHLIHGSGHSPSNLIGWSSFAIYTVFYWVVFLVVYVIMLEFYLLRNVLHHLEDAKSQMTAEQPSSQLALEKVGNAVKDLETRRRKHFLLQPMDLDLTEAPHLVAAKAISRAGQTRPVKGILKNLEAKIRAEKTPLQASLLMANLKKDAAAFAAGKPAGN